LLGNINRHIQAWRQGIEEFAHLGTVAAAGFDKQTIAADLFGNSLGIITQDTDFGARRIILSGRADLVKQTRSNFIIEEFRRDTPWMLGKTIDYFLKKNSLAWDADRKRYKRECRSSRCPQQGAIH
jgi:hypothetical protein